MQHWKRNKKPEFGVTRIITSTWGKRKKKSPNQQTTKFPKTPVKHPSKKQTNKNPPKTKSHHHHKTPNPIIIKKKKKKLTKTQKTQLKNLYIEISWTFVLKCYKQIRSSENPHHLIEMNIWIFYIKLKGSFHFKSFSEFHLLSHEEQVMSLVTDYVLITKNRTKKDWFQNSTYVK